MRIGLMAAVLAVVVAGACTDPSLTPTGPGTFTVPVQFEAAQHAGEPHNFRTNLSGGEEVPANDSQATGQAIFQISEDGMTLSYKLIVANIENVTQAHIHLAPTGVNGAVVAWLYPAAAPPQLIPGRTDGILAEGVITEASLVGSLAGAELSVLIEEMQAGNTYVNVHTSQFPPGEVRGQIH